MSRETFCEGEIFPTMFDRRSECSCIIEFIKQVEEMR